MINLRADTSEFEAGLQAAMTATRKLFSDEQRKAMCGPYAVYVPGVGWTTKELADDIVLRSDGDG